MRLYGEVSISRVLSRSGDMVGQNLAAIVAIAILPVLLSVSLRLYGFQVIVAAFKGTAFEGGTNPYWFGGSAVLVAIALSAFCQGSLVRIVLSSIDGRQADTTEAMLSALLTLPQLFLLTLTMEVAITAATLILIVPGILLSLVWCVALPVLMGEGRGVIGSLGRSYVLTSGARGKIFGVYALFWVALFVVTLIVGMITRSIYGVSTPSLVGHTLPVAYVVINGLSSLVVGIGAAAVCASLYVELRHWKDGASAGVLDQIFA
ncbi:MAG: hypothetical protein V4459_14930 [Pseudomonadota bacterium]